MRDPSDLLAPIRAFNAGWTARERGEKQIANPYNPRVEPILYDEWAAGWFSADRVDHMIRKGFQNGK